MRRWLSSGLLALAAVYGLATQAHAQPVAPAVTTEATAAESRQARAVIEAQLKAFAAADGPRAFAYAAPGIRELFGTAPRFLSMVRSSYPVLLNPVSVVFLKLQRSAVGADPELVQAVQLTDGEGRLWLATYHLQQQADKSWLIAGCELASNQGRAT